MKESTILFETKYLEKSRKFFEKFINTVREDGCLLQAPYL